MTFAFPLELTIKGSLVFLVVSVLNQLWAKKMTARWRRIWWLLVPVAYLLPVSLPPLVLARYSMPTHPLFIDHVIGNVAALTAPWTSAAARPFAPSDISWPSLIWLAGMIVSALFIMIPTWKVQRKWSTKRLSMDPVLLNLLEDAKAAAAVTAPMGMVVSDEIAAPAILGWLRPRILIPTSLASGSPDELRVVLLHELAHFKSLDIPLNWFFAAVRVVHWFNPLAWLAYTNWARFIEEAADENAIRWMTEPNATAYGEILLKTLANCPGGPAPYGALAIGETIENLKRRVVMIRNFHSKSHRGWMASIVALTLGVLMTSSATLPGDDNPDTAKKDAVAAMQTWLGDMDSGDYAKSWSDSAKSFQGAVSSDKWATVSTTVRTPLGKLISRKLGSALFQNGINSTGAQPIEGIFVIAQFDTSFENLKYARETVTFEKEADGKWRAAGYFIKPQ